MESRGDYFDGQSSANQQVTLLLDSSQLIIRGEQLELVFPLTNLRLSDALGNVNRSIYLPEGGKCEIRNSAFATALQKQLGKGSFLGQVHRWENSLKLASLALVITGVMIWAFIQFGIPILAKQMAHAIPTSTEETMGEEVFVFLDRSIFAESGVPEWRQEEVALLFETVLTGLEQDSRNYQLKFRESELLGANALALPGGMVIVTDGLLELVDHEEELAAVLAHEIGHIRHRHALRQIIQDSTASLLLATLTGDILSSSSLAAALPTMLIDAKFSRDMEQEADEVAAAYLLHQNIPLKHFANILTNLQQQGQDNNPEQPSALGYLSTHPATKERIEHLMQAGK